MDRAAEHRVDESDVANDKSIGVEATMAMEMIQHADEELVSIFVVTRRERRRECLQVIDEQRGHHGRGSTGENASKTASRAERRQRRRSRMTATTPRGERDWSTTLSTLGRTAKEATGTGMLASGEKGYQRRCVNKALKDCIDVARTTSVDETWTNVERSDHGGGRWSE
jgi:hypothetical protein